MPSPPRRALEFARFLGSKTPPTRLQDSRVCRRVRDRTRRAAAPGRSASPRLPTAIYEANATRRRYSIAKRHLPKGSRSHRLWPKRWMRRRPDRSRKAARTIAGDAIRDAIERVRFDRRSKSRTLNRAGSNAFPAASAASRHSISPGPAAGAAWAAPQSLRTKPGCAPITGQRCCTIARSEKRPLQSASEGRSAATSSSCGIAARAGPKKEPEIALRVPWVTMPAVKRPSPSGIANQSPSRYGRFTTKRCSGGGRRKEYRAEFGALQRTPVR